MKKSDLKSGMVVKTRDGWYGVVLIGCDFVYDCGESNNCILGLNSPTTEWMSLNEFTDDLKNVGGKNQFDIVRVYRPYIPCYVFQYDNEDYSDIGDCIYNIDYEV